MNHDLTDITIILDRSGSMQGVRDDTIGGYNTFISEQAKLPGEARMTLVQFDDQYERVYMGVRVGEVRPLDHKTFVPRGSTALLDAIGRTISETGSRLAALAEADRPGKVIMVIITDGYENASKEFKRERVFSLINHQREHYSWDFVFLGANQDAIAAGAAIGVMASKVMSYAADAKGMQDVFASTSNYVGTMRATGQATFSDDDRAKQHRSPT